MRVVIHNRFRVLKWGSINVRVKLRNSKYSYQLFHSLQKRLLQTWRIKKRLNPGLEQTQDAASKHLGFHLVHTYLWYWIHPYSVTSCPTWAERSSPQVLVRVTKLLKSWTTTRTTSFRAFLLHSSPPQHNLDTYKNFLHVSPIQLL